jgi:hypothetical protein
MVFFWLTALTEPGIIPRNNPLAQVNIISLQISAEIVCKDYVSNE